MGMMSILGSLIGLFVGIVGFFEKELLLSIFGFSIFILGIVLFISLEKQKENFKKECDKDIMELSKNPTRKNKRNINQLKILRELR